MTDATQVEVAVAKSIEITRDEVLINGEPFPYFVGTKIDATVLDPGHGDVPPLYEVHLRVLAEHFDARDLRETTTVMLHREIGKD